MLVRPFAMFLALSLGLTSPLAAQLPDWVNDILVAARLPVAADEARREGASSSDIRAVLEAMSKARVPAHEATVIFDTARVVRREHGPVDNFGAFVQSQLAEGKRGRELAAAIRAEHARRGKGNAGRSGQGAGRSDDDDDDDDDDDRGRGQGKDSANRARGRDDARTPSRPDSALGNQRGRGQGSGRPARPDR